MSIPTFAARKRAGVAEKEAKTRLEQEVQGGEHTVTKLEERFWDKRPDGIVMDRGVKAC